MEPTSAPGVPDLEAAQAAAPEQAKLVQAERTAPVAWPLRTTAMSATVAQVAPPEQARLVQADPTAPVAWPPPATATSATVAQVLQVAAPQQAQLVQAVQTVVPQQVMEPQAAAQKPTARASWGA